VTVAALYDVHGNLPALEAVLVDPAFARADAVVVGGDVATGLARESFVEPVDPDWVAPAVRR
jgi:Icc-related predicted phosphoesterase